MISIGIKCLPYVQLKVKQKDGLKTIILNQYHYFVWLTTICMMYVHYKLLNPTIPSKVIVNRIKHNGKTFLNRYMKYIENTIKNKQIKHKSKSIKTF